MITNRKQVIVQVVTMMAVIISTVSCKREYLPLPEDNKRLMPNEKNLILKNDSMAILNTRKYIDALEFSLAIQEAQNISEQHTRDSLRSQITILENLADRYLLYFINSQGKKKYILGEKRIKDFYEKGYVNIMDNLTLIEFYSEKEINPNKHPVIPHNAVAIFNMGAFPYMKTLALPGAGIEYLDLSALKHIQSFHLKSAKSGMTVNLENASTLTSIEMNAVSNLRLKLHPKAVIKLKITNSFFKDLSELNIDQVKIISLENVKLIDNELLKTTNSQLEEMTISVGGSPALGEDGSTYSPFSFDNKFITKINEHLPHLKKLTVRFADKESYQRADFSSLAMPTLEELCIAIDDYKTGATTNENNFERFSIKHCPRLKLFKIEGFVSRGIDLSRLTTQTVPLLREIHIRASVDKLIMPESTNEITTRLAVNYLKEIVLSDMAKQKQILSFDYHFENSLFYNKTLYLDWAYLKTIFKTILGYPILAPPSEFIPISKTEHLTFVKGKIMDFSGPQWKGFKGRIYPFKHNAIDYLDFGHLTSENFVNKVIQVNHRCVVKNLPNNISIHYANFNQ